MIKTCWDKNNVCSNGLNAMYYALEFYNETNNFDNFEYKNKNKDYRV